MLERYKIAQYENYNNALGEIKQGKKQTHWIWYIFPQLKELGVSDTSKYYGINGIEEAKEYYNDDYLRNNLIEICNVLLNIQNKTIQDIFDWDDRKVQSSMTLFYIASDNKLFKDIIDKYFEGQFDNNTLELLK